jgi:PilZ domain-containing protein
MLKAFSKSSAPARSPYRKAVSGDPGEGNVLFEALVCEFHWTALQIGAIASCINASVASGRTWMLRSCNNLLPVESPIVKVALRSWENIGLPGKLAESINGIYFDLSDAKAKARPVISQAGAFVGPEISLAKLEQITALWRKLADDCKTTVQLLEPETRWRLGSLYTANALVLGKFLKEATSGSYACVNQVGEVAIPVLPQRRKSRRYVLLQPCKVTTQDATSVAFAREISKNSIGLDCEQDFKLKERILVELRSGRKMKGIVAWSQKKKVVVQFDEALDDGDPLIGG